MEILSPAGKMEHIKVAIDEKANAVYGGLKKWNARNKAINFSSEEYNYLVNELHKHNIKFYLTLNILMLDEEIDEAIQFLKNNTLPDAFISTDIGLILALQENFPEVPVHLSTQFGCHNIDDVRYAKTLKSSRAILSRELTLNEIEKIRDNSDLELECFVWGSQCLSFSGLCFFGSLINGGAGNRGKCMITCRDIYEIDENKGHYLYVPDMDCINLISKLDKFDCLKLEGRRRNPEEIRNILKTINNKIHSDKECGYLYGTSLIQNGLYEKINSRVKPYKKASEFNNIDDNDILIRFKDGKPVKFVDLVEDEDTYYMYTEIKKPYKINKKNIFIDISIDGNIISEVLYLNHKGEGHTFFCGKDDCVEVNFSDFINELESTNKDINVYKIKYIKNIDGKIYINKEDYKKIINYIFEDCRIASVSRLTNKSFKIDKLYLETREIEVAKEFLNDNQVKVIYDIETVSNLKNIDEIVNILEDQVIYKLPLFNWESEELEPFLRKLNDKEVMFTRFSQIQLFRNIDLKKKYADYTMYIWNKKTLNYLIKNGFSEFSASPELSYERNKQIYGNSTMQVIIGGKLPLVFTRNCFSHLYKCSSCNLCRTKPKHIKNVDKDLEFDILCNTDYRYILNNEPILNDYSRMKVGKNTKFKYVTNGQSLDDIKESVCIFKGNNYFEELRKLKYWNGCYECNLIDGKD